jgi:hypothetical protein
MPRIIALTATVENMRRVGAPGVIAYDRSNGDEYSATPGDYFWMPEREAPIDQNGRPLILVRRETHMVPVLP